MKIIDRLTMNNEEHLLMNIAGIAETIKNYEDILEGFRADKKIYETQLFALMRELKQESVEYDGKKITIVPAKQTKRIQSLAYMKLHFADIIKTHAITKTIKSTKMLSLRDIKVKYPKLIDDNPTMINYSNSPARLKLELE